MTREEAIQIIELYTSELKQRAKYGYFCIEEKDVYLYQLQAFDMAIEALSADAVPQLKQTDTLIIADALRYLAKDTERHLVDRTRADALRQQFLKYGASMCKGGDHE